MSGETPDKLDLYQWLMIIFLAGAAIFLMQAIPNYLRARTAGLYNGCQSSCKNIGTAMEMYHVDNEKKYPPSLAVLTPGYLNAIPACPASGTNRGYMGSYRVTADFSAYTFYCAGAHHRGIDRNLRDRPLYNSREGLFCR